MKRYGVHTQTAAVDGTDPQVEEIGLIGYSIIQSVVPPAVLEVLRDRIDEYLALQVASAGGEDVARRIGEFGTLRASVTLDPIFLDIARNKHVLSVVSRLLGKYFILMLQNAIVSYPAQDHHQSAYHRDLPYQHFVTSRPLAVNALLCVDDFTTVTGCTRVIPGSHKTENFPSDQSAHRLELPIQAPAGSFIMFDAMLYHRGGENVSERPRRAINTCYSLPFIKQQIDLPAVLGDGHQLDPDTARLLGFGSRTAESIADWYLMRKRRLEESAFL